MATLTRWASNDSQTNKLYLNNGIGNPFNGVGGETDEPYLTFHDGWRYQVVIDAIRHGRGWYRVLEMPGG
jgi:hypothetical protein